jgi:hypothetical protein
MKLRTILLLVVLIGSLFLGSFAQAQDMPVDPCFGLAQADCDVINAASANGTGGATSFSLDFSIKFSAANIPDETMPGAVFNAAGTVDLVPGASADIPFNIGSVIAASFGPDAAAVTELPLEVRLVDGVLYYTDPSTGGTWMGVDLMATLASPEFQEQLGMLGVDPTAPDLGLTDAAMNATGGLDPAALGPLLELVNLPGLISYTRSGDTFTFVLDLTAMQALLSPEYEAQLNAITDALSQVDPSSAMLVTLIPTLIQQGTITVSQTVNTSLNIVETINFNVAATIDTMMLTGQPAEPALVNLDVVLTLKNLNSAPAPVAPEGATMIDAAGM